MYTRRNNRKARSRSDHLSSPPFSVWKEKKKKEKKGKVVRDPDEIIRDDAGLL
jgi:hypothetical protein